MNILISGTVTRMALSDEENVAMVCPDGVPFDAGAEIPVRFDPPWLPIKPVELLGRRVEVFETEVGPLLKLERDPLAEDVEPLGA